MGFPEAAIAIYCAIKFKFGREMAGRQFSRGTRLHTFRTATRWCLATRVELPCHPGSEDGVKESAEKIANILVGEDRVVDQVLEQERIRERAEPCSGANARYGQIAADFVCDAVDEVAGTGAKRALARSQSRMGLGMANREQLKFQRQQGEPAILRNLRVMLAQGA